MKSNKKNDKKESATQQLLNLKQMLKNRKYFRFFIFKYIICPIKLAFSSNRII